MPAIARRALPPALASLLAIVSLNESSSHAQATLSGDCGDRCEVTGPGPWVADDTFVATQGRNRDGTQFGVTIVDAGGGSWHGGLFESEWRMPAADFPGDSWQEAKDVDGSCLRVQGGPFRVEAVECRRAEDAIRFQFGGANRAEAVGVWIRDTFDDSIEADGRPEHVRIARSFIDNTHGFLSVRRGRAMRDGNPPPVLIEVTDTVITMSETHYDPRDKRKQPWSGACEGPGISDPRDDYGHAHFIKTESVSGDKKGARDTILFRNVVVAEWCLAKQTKSNTRLFDPGQILHPESSFTYVWLGPQTSAGNGGVAMVNVDGVMIPEQLGIHEYPDALINVTDDPAVLDAAVDHFFANYWRQSAGPGPDPEPDPDPAPDCDDELAAALALVASLEANLADVESERDQAVADRDAALALARSRRDAIDAAQSALGAAP